MVLPPWALPTALLVGLLVTILLVRAWNGGDPLVADLRERDEPVLAGLGTFLVALALLVGAGGIGIAVCDLQECVSVGIPIEVLQALAIGFGLVLIVAAVLSQSSPGMDLNFD